MQYTYLTISTAPGNPSVYWKSNSGKYYRTLKEAKADTGTNTLPDPTTIKTGTGSDNLVIIAIFILVLFVAYKIIK